MGRARWRTLLNDDDVRHMTVGDVVEVDGVKLLRTLTGFERIP